MTRRVKPLLRRSCANCGQSFQTRREEARFCPSAVVDRASSCQVAFANRMANRGKVVLPYVMAWVEGRGGGHAGTHPVAGRSLSELTSIVRDFIDEDREAGRPSSVDYAESLFANGILHMDRKRR